MFFMPEVSFSGNGTDFTQKVSAAPEMWGWALMGRGETAKPV